MPPLAPMLAKLVRALPEGDLVYEPKWDGFRCIAFADGAAVDLRSRHDRPLARYFPELVASLRELAPEGVALDGEIINAGAPDFDALMLRLHPSASRVERLARETPAAFVAFDLLAVGAEDLRERPFEARRAKLEDLVRGRRVSDVRVTPATDDAQTARRWLEAFAGNGIDGVMAKPKDVPYRPGVRALFKVKHERTADCVVGGFRSFVGRRAVGSLLLGLYNAAGELEHVGVAASFSAKRHDEIATEVVPRITRLAGHPWQQGFLLGGGAGGRLAGAAGRWSPDEMELNWIPVKPTLVCEVAYDRVDRSRFRHAARFRRWRPDREPDSCTLDQLDVVAPSPAVVLASS